MPVQATCPQGHVLNLADQYAGKVIACPKCKTKFKVETGSNAKPPKSPPKKASKEKELEEEISPEEKALEKKDEKRFQLTLALAGLQFQYIKIIHMMVVISLLGLTKISFKIGNTEWTIGAGARDGFDTPWSQGTSIRIAFVCWAMASLQGVCGSLLVIFAPRKSSTRGLALASLGCDFLNLVGFLLMMLLAFNWISIDLEQSKRLEGLLHSGRVVMTLLGTVLFLSALRPFCVFLGDSLIGNRALTLLPFFIPLYVVFMVLERIVNTSESLKDSISGLVLKVIVVISSFFLLSYFGKMLRLLTELKSLVAKKM